MMFDFVCCVETVSKNVTTLSSYNFDIHELILIIFGKNVAEKVSSQKVHYFPSSHNLWFCTIWGNAVCGFVSKHIKRIKILPVIAEPPCIVKAIDCVHRTRRSRAEGMLPSCLTFTKSVTVSVPVSKWELFFMKAGVIVTEISYYGRPM